LEGIPEMHLTSETAFDFLEGRLDNDHDDFWSRHMKTCRTCASDILQLQRLRVDLRRQHLASASEAEIENAVRIFPRVEQDAGSSVRWVVARIVFNSFLQPSMAGVRGASPEPAHQFVLRDDDFDIHIKMWGADSNRRIRGQLLPRSGKDFMQSAQCHLLHKGARVQSTSTDDTGEFHFDEVPDGDLTLQVDLPGLTIVGSLNVQDTP
jgi:hypothetical protein